MTTIIPDNESDYGDFGNEEELEIIDQLLGQVGEESLIVTDIEDYEAPRGARVPKILGIETHSSPIEVDIEVLRDLEATRSELRTNYYHIYWQAD